MEAETSQAVGGHLPSVPLLSRSLRLLFIRRHPIGEGPGLLPTTSLELGVAPTLRSHWWVVLTTTRLPE